MDHQLKDLPEGNFPAKPFFGVDPVIIDPKLVSNVQNTVANLNFCLINRRENLLKRLSLAIFVSNKLCQEWDEASLVKYARKPLRTCTFNIKVVSYRYTL